MVELIHQCSKSSGTFEQIWVELPGAPSDSALPGIYLYTLTVICISNNLSVQLACSQELDDGKLSLLPNCCECWEDVLSLLQVVIYESTESSEHLWGPLGEVMPLQTCSVHSCLTINHLLKPTSYISSNTSILPLSELYVSKGD